MKQKIIIIGMLIPFLSVLFITSCGKEYQPTGPQPAELQEPIEEVQVQEKAQETAEQATEEPGGNAERGTHIDLDTVPDITYFGRDAFEQSGSSTAVGDLNNDGIDDLVVGANQARNPSGPNFAEGETYVIYGPLPASGTFDLDSEPDVTYYGRDWADSSGTATTIGDLNNDGVNDLVIGANFAINPSGPGGGEGETYVIYGPLPASGTFDLNTEPDVTYYGRDVNDRSGSALATGDLNNDGINDLVIGANIAGNPSGPNSNEGETHVIYGPLPASGNLDLDTEPDVTYFGRDSGDGSGIAVATGDLNNDGIDDLVIGARGAEQPGGDGEGETYIIYGPLPASGTFDLDTELNVTYFGRYESDLSGTSTAVGDLNNDGIDDLVIGAYAAGNPYGSNLDEGETYVIYGPLPASGTFDLDTEPDVTYFGQNPSDNSGSATAVGDLNKDGIDDLVIGAYDAEQPGGNAEGETYVIYGPLPASGTFDLDTEPDKFMSPKCQMPTGVACTFRIDSGAGEIEVVIRNGMGSDIDSISITASDCTTAATTPSSLNYGENGSFTIGGCNFAAGRIYEGDLNFTYRNVASELTHMLVGSISEVVK